MDKMLTILREIRLPFAYRHFAEGESPRPPFLCFLSSRSDNFAADGKAYHKITEYVIEMYTDRKSPPVERQVEAVLDRHGLFYSKSELWIERERLYVILYSFELED